MESLLGNNVRLSHKLTSVAKDGKNWLSTFQTPKGTVQIRSKALLVTAPSYVAAPLLSGEGGVLPEASSLANIYYPPVASVTLAYPNTCFKVSTHS